MLDRLTKTLDFQSQALVLRSERQRLIASNIANADTPGYVARDFNFAQALREANGELPVKGTLAVTSAGHIPVTGGATSEAEMNYSLAAQTNLDRNTVDMDRERASFADNAVKFEATLRFLNSSVRNVLDAIKGSA